MLIKAKTLKGFKLDSLDGKIGEVSWTDRKVFIDLTRDAIRAAPTYKNDEPISRSYENSLFQHYGSNGYWAVELHEHSTK